MSGVLLTGACAHLRPGVGNIKYAALCRRGLHQCAVYEIPEVQDAMHKLSIDGYEDWYGVPNAHVSEIAGKRKLIQTYHSHPLGLVNVAFPQHVWEQQRFISQQNTPPRLALQSLAQRTVRAIFPSCTIISNYHTTELLFESGRQQEIDIFLPQLKIGFEYQEAHHYFASHYGSTALTNYQERDNKKREAAAAAGITLFVLPFWWDFNKDSLIATLKAIRPDLVPNLITNADPIPNEIPAEALSKHKLEIPGLGLPMLVLHAPSSGFDPTAWLIFEKYDGIRAVWSGEHRTYYSRFGRKIHLPLWTEDVMPLIWLDGEFWFGPTSQKDAYNLVHVRISKTRWDDFQYVVFDSPQDLSEDYSTRYEKISSTERFSAWAHPFMKRAPFIACISQGHAECVFNAFIAVGGEGIIVRQPYSLYTSGYSSHLYKYKKYKDAEALVVKQVSATRWRCSLASALGHTKPDMLLMTVHSDFVGDTTDIVAGCIVSFKYTGNYSGSGRPMNPRITRVRKDIKFWDEVAKVTPSNRPEHLSSTKLWRPRMIGSWKTRTSRRQFFDKLAQDMRFDPLLAENWYLISANTVKQKVGGRQIIHYHGSYADALIDLYPELELQKHKFGVVSNKWQDWGARRDFFDQLADDLGVASSEQWYRITRSDVFRKKGAEAVLEYHNKSFVRALIELYPELGLKAHLFFFAPDSTWQDEIMQRHFFAQLMVDSGCFPGNREEWYTLSIQRIKARRGGANILSQYGSLGDAIVHLFPEMSLNSAKFITRPRKQASNLHKTPPPSMLHSLCIVVTKVRSRKRHKQQRIF